MPKVKESSLRGILRTFLVNFFGISLPLLLSEYTLPRLTRVSRFLRSSIERTTRHARNCSRIFPSLSFSFPPSFTVLPKTRLSRPSPTIVQHRFAAASSPRFFLRKRSRPRGEHPSTNFFLSRRGFRSRVCGKRFRSGGIVKGMDSKSCNTMYLSFFLFFLFEK